MAGQDLQGGVALVARDLEPLLIRLADDHVLVPDVIKARGYVQIERRECVEEPQVPQLKRVIPQVHVTKHPDLGDQLVPEQDVTQAGGFDARVAAVHLDPQGQLVLSQALVEVSFRERHERGISRPLDERVDEGPLSFVPDCDLEILGLFNVPHDLKIHFQEGPGRSLFHRKIHGPGSGLVVRLHVHKPEILPRHIQPLGTAPVEVPPPDIAPAVTNLTIPVGRGFDLETGAAASSSFFPVVEKGHAGNPGGLLTLGGDLRQ